MSVRVAAIVAAAGESRRMGQNKLLINLVGQPVVRRSVRAVCGCAQVEGIFVCVHPQKIDMYRSAIGDVGRAYQVIAGGKSRQESVWAGLQAALAEGYGRVVIHDGARPLVSRRLLQEVAVALDQYRAVTAAVPLTDTIKRVEDGKVMNTVDRSNMYIVQTPQAFHLDVIIEAHERSRQEGWIVTDDAGLIECAGREVHVVNGDVSNIKLTTPADIDTAARLISGEIDLRVGMGFDIHRSEPGQKLVLGGVTIDHYRGLAGHSDADAVCHAVMDAVLGASGLPDIGTQFPDDDPCYEDADSLELLQQTYEMVVQAGYRLTSIDITIVADEPRIAPYVSDMKEKLATVVGLRPDRVGIKATRSEGVFVGRSLPGIAVWAIATIRQIA